MQTQLTNQKYLKERLNFFLTETTKKTPKNAKLNDWYVAFVNMLNDELVDLADVSEHNILNRKNKMVAYLSMEYLLGKLSRQSLLNMGAYESFKKAFASYKVDLDELLKLEPSTQLGNGGLGRLAACFFDSLATLDYPAFGYGLLYRCGIYKQEIKNNIQVEKPDIWIEKQNPAIDKRRDIAYTVNFGGYVKKSSRLEDMVWMPSEAVKAFANDVLIAGYDTDNTLRIRLWEAERNDKSKPDLKKNITNLTDFLYPPDSTFDGRKLRLRQEYLLVSASIQDLFERFKKTGVSVDKIEKFLAVQLNDTHPTLAIPEIIKILMQDYNMPYEQAFEKMNKICAYTNHTLLAEALEKIDINLFKSELPYHFAIIERINEDFMNMAKRTVADWKLNKIEIINYRDNYINCGNLCIVATHKVNGVAALHSKLLKKKEFAVFSSLFPKKFTNETNGITQRKWLLESNPKLSNLITKTIGNEWVKDLTKLKKLLKYKNDENFLAKLEKVKMENKVAFAEFVKNELHIKISPNFIIDSQIKRIHEYKRQFLNIMQVIDRYNRIIDGDTKGMEAKVYVFAGKAHPSYTAGKEIITLINDVADVVNKDKRCNDLLKVVFVPNYNIDKAQMIISATEVSEQISTAGKEASGTGNMKFALNGALTIGTLDGANVEIRDKVGSKNIFIFGLNAKKVYNLKERGYDAQKYFNDNPRIQRIVEQIMSGYFCHGDTSRYKTLMESFFNNNDEYMLLADFNSYIKAQSNIDEMYKNKKLWLKKSLINIANCGFFSSDRTIKSYAKDIWKIKEIKE